MKKHSKLRRATFIGAFLSLFLHAPTFGASITWQTAQDTTGIENLISGTSINAFNGGSATVTATGIDFTSIDLGNGHADNIYDGTITSTGNADFDDLIESLTYGGGTDTAITLTGLTSGTAYTVQVFFNDQRSSTSARVMTFGDGLGNTVNVAASATTGAQLDDYGQFAIGTFTADATTQTLRLITNDFNQAHVNAVYLTGPAVPDVPTNLAATGLNGSVSLDWDDSQQVDFSNFIVKRSTSQGGPYMAITGATPTVSGYTDTSVVNETTYFYVVSAVNSSAQESAASNEVEGMPTATPAPIPPNFMFILTDDQDTYSIGAYRNSEPVETAADGSDYTIDTPNIDRLAAEGMLFHQARLMGGDKAAVCTASRTCLMTGKTTWQRTDGITAPVTFPGIFNRGARNGQSDLPYATYRTNKFKNSYTLANEEFQVLDEKTQRGNTDGSGSEWHADHVLNYLNDWQTNHQPNEKPFFIWFGLSHPHDTRLAREELVDRYGCVNTAAPETLVADADAPPLPANHLPVDESTGIPDNFPFHPFENGHNDVRDEIAAEGMDMYRTEVVVRNEIGRNFACVDWIDQQVGRILDKLEDPNDDGNTADSILDNTYIVYSSDHGIAIGRHGLQGKQNLYEHTWRVPYIVRGPGVAAGSHTDALIYLHDTFPTFCDLAGLDIPTTIDGNDGQSYRAVIEGTGEGRDALFGVYAGGAKPGMRSVTDGRFKLIKYDVDDNATQVTQLFDLQTNPFELLPEHGVPNIATDPAYASIRLSMEELMTQQRIENADPYSFLGDRTVLRFEDGTDGQTATTLTDHMPFQNDGSAASGNGGALPTFSSDVPNATDYVIGESNTASLDFEQDAQNYVQVSDAGSLDFGDAPFTIEAWVKLETLPTSNDTASAMPVVMKRATSTTDTDIDYMFLAAAGNYGSATTYNRIALVLGATTIISDLAIPDTDWHAISVAFDSVANTVRFILDGQTDTKTTTANGTENDGPLWIGAHLDSSGNVDSAFDGLIDELSITDGALAIAELQPLAQIVPVTEFEIIDFELTDNGNTIDLSFESNDSRLYTVQRSFDLSPDSWVDVQTFMPGASNASQTTLSDLPSESENTKAFYRVITAN